MASLINSTTQFINDAYDYYLWTLSLAGNPLKFYYIRLIRPNYYTINFVIFYLNLNKCHLDIFNKL